LRREGIYSTDLARIRQKIKEGALDRLADRPGLILLGVYNRCTPGLASELSLTTIVMIPFERPEKVPWPTEEE